MRLLLIVTFPLQVVPSWPLHTNEPVKQYKAVHIPDYSVDFATYQPMEPQVGLPSPGVPHHHYIPAMYPTSVPHHCTHTPPVHLTSVSWQ